MSHFFNSFVVCVCLKNDDIEERSILVFFSEEKKDKKRDNCKEEVIEIEEDKN